MNTQTLKYINNWAEHRSKKKNTQNNFKNSLKAFVKALDIKDLQAYLKQDREFDEDLGMFIAYLNKDHYDKRTKTEKPYSPKTKQVYITCIKVFLERELIKKDNFTEKDLLRFKYKLKDIKSGNGLKNPKPITAKRTPTNNELKYILSFADLKLKAIAMVLATSGVRPDECLHLKLNEIKDRYIRVNWTNAKSDYPRDTFMTVETKQTLDAYMREREKLIASGYKKSHFVRINLEQEGYRIKKEESKGIPGRKHIEWHIFDKNGKELSKDEIIRLEPRVFPFSIDNIQKAWGRLLERAGTPYNDKDTTTGRYIFNLYCLRRFFENQLENSGINPHYFNYMIGHESELNITYRDNFPIDKLQEEYDKHSTKLSIFSTPVNIGAISEQLQQKDKQIQELEKKIDEINQTMLLILAKKQIEKN